MSITEKLLENSVDIMVSIGKLIGADNEDCPELVQDFYYDWLVGILVVGKFFDTLLDVYAAYWLQIVIMAILLGIPIWLLSTGR
jgi:hypothetical protein